MNKVWTYYIFLVFIALGGCQQVVVTPKSVKGILDLRQYSFNNNESIPLNGEWEFFWQKLYNPVQIPFPSSSTPYIKVPSAWSTQLFKGKKYPEKGFATYRLKTIINRTKIHQPLALKIRIIQTSYNLFIQGKKINSGGKPGKSIETTTPLLGAGIFEFTPASDTIDIVLQVACFHNNAGGLPVAIELGNAQTLSKVFQYGIYIDFLLLGSLFIISLYHFSLYYYRQQSLSPVYFGIFCFIVAFRLLALSQFNLAEVVPAFTYERIQKISYFSYYGGVMIFLLLIWSLFVEEFKLIVLKVSGLITGPLVALILFSHNYIYNKTLPYFQLFSLVVILYVFYVLILAVIRKKDGGRTFLFGFIAIAGTTINDILYANHVIDTGHYFPWGLFLFILAQAVVLSGRFSKAFVRAEDLTHKLNNLNQNLEQKVQNRTQSLENTRQELQRKNDNITASINYAQRIQQAMLPRWVKVQQHLPDSFLMFMSKDLVSGDFYWFACTSPEPVYDEELTSEGVQRVFKGVNKGKIILAAVDCTGHGVPGAFMSLIGNNLLNQIILEKKISSPGLILSELNIQVKQSLKQSETHNRDGMDMTLVMIDLQENIMEFAGARNPLYCIQNNELRIIKGTKLSIGGKHHQKVVVYNNHRIDISQPTTFYMASDGFQDQFGGKENKKFMVRRFRQLLFDIHVYPFAKQQKILEQTLTEWMQSEQEQVDDILVIGAKIS